MEAQRRRKAKKSQLVVTELRPPDTQSPAFPSQSPGAHGRCLSPPAHTLVVGAGHGYQGLPPVPHSTPPHPYLAGRQAPRACSPTVQGAPQCCCNACRETGRRLEAAAVLLLRRPGVSGQRRGEAWEHPPAGLDGYWWTGRREPGRR